MFENSLKLSYLYFVVLLLLSFDLVIPVFVPENEYESAIRREPEEVWQTLAGAGPNFAEQEQSAGEFGPISLQQEKHQRDLYNSFALHEHQNRFN
ncbi:hypothetical protein J6590_086883 [Homalodisca vitripennis]|nr:hypothetical protein J6590_086883 [Homalodisca vitripennis]